MDEDVQISMESQGCLLVLLSGTDVRALIQPEPGFLLTTFLSTCEAVEHCMKQTIQ